MLHLYTKTCYHQLRPLISLTPTRCYVINHNEVRTWTHSLRELLHRGKPEEVIKQYRNRPSSLSDLSVQTYCIIFKAYTLTKNWSEGRQLYDQIQTDTKLTNDQRLKIASRFKRKLIFHF
jgi:pentatricopeptide repeat protein